MITEDRSPAADMAVEWTPSTGSDHYPLVSDWSDDTYCSYNAEDTVRDLFNFENFTIPEEAKDILVLIYIRGKSTNPATQMGGSLRLWEGDTDYTTYDLWPYPWSTDWNTSYVDWALNPSTELAWTPGQINGTEAPAFAQFGYGCQNEAASTIYVSEVYLEIRYTIQGKPHGYVFIL
jgi:hypothetical protein